MSIIRRRENIGTASTYKLIEWKESDGNDAFDSLFHTDANGAIDHSSGRNIIKNVVPGWSTPGKLWTRQKFENVRKLRVTIDYNIWEYGQDFTFVVFPTITDSIYMIVMYGNWETYVDDNRSSSRTPLNYYTVKRASVGRKHYFNITIESDYEAKILRMYQNNQVVAQYSYTGNVVMNDEILISWVSNHDRIVGLNMHEIKIEVNY